MPNIDLNSFQQLVQNFKNIVKSSGEAKIDEQTFLEKVTKDKSIFAMLDNNRDGKISEEEMQTVLQADSDNDGIVTNNELACMEQMKFFAKRTGDKWFALDVNRDGHWSNVEEKLGNHRLWGDASTYTGLDAAMSNEQLAKLYDMQETVDDPNNEQLEQWLNGWLEDLKQDAKNMFGVELSNSQIIVLKKEYIKQLNTWLFKTGDNATENAPLYNSLNNTAYTRLITSESTTSCCGGDIIPPPATPTKNSCSYVFSSLSHSKEEYERLDKEREKLLLKFDAGELTKEEYDNEIKKLYKLSNTSEEVKNRLAWAMYPMSQELKEIISVFQIQNPCRKLSLHCIFDFAFFCDNFLFF